MTQKESVLDDRRKKRKEMHEQARLTIKNINLCGVAVLDIILATRPRLVRSR
jgi:hypothetical protein